MNRGRDIISKEMVVISIEIIKIITQERALVRPKTPIDHAVAIISPYSK